VFTNRSSKGEMPAQVPALSIPAKATTLNVFFSRLSAMLVDDLTKAATSSHCRHQHISQVRAQASL
jgi:hypothetical protein